MLENDGMWNHVFLGSVNVHRLLRNFKLLLKECVFLHQVSVNAHKLLHYFIMLLQQVTLKPTDAIVLTHAVRQCCAEVSSFLTLPDQVTFSLSSWPIAVFPAGKN